jgi:hypothetical protein
MDQTPEAIVAFARERARDEWQPDKPYLLARLSPDLKEQGVDYKEVLQGQRLKDFLRSVPDQVRLVFHPDQRSKVGVVLPENDFEFGIAQNDGDEPRPNTRHEHTNLTRRRYLVMGFLQLLGELDQRSAEQVVIPTHILSRLLRDQ